MKATTQARIDRVTNLLPTGMMMTDDVRALVGECVRRTLLEQDKVTRHACAEAVNEAHYQHWLDQDIPVPEAATAATQRAHQACINTQAV